MSIYLTILLEFLLLSSSILILFEFRHKIGLAPLYLILGAIQYLQAFSGKIISFNLLGDVATYPNSKVLFCSVLFALLLVYIKEGVSSTRTLILGIIISNFFLSILFSVSYTQELYSTGFDKVESSVFFMNQRFVISGTLVLLLDFLLIITAYQTLVSKFSKLNYFVILFLSLLFVLVFDVSLLNVLFNYGSQSFNTALSNNILGVLITATLFALVLYIYIKYKGKQKNKASFIAGQNRDVFSILRYQSTYKNAYVKNELETQLISTLNSISDGFVSLDSNWCYTYLNDKAVEYIGRSRESLIGKNMWEEFPEGVGSNFYKTYKKAFSTQETQYFEDYYQGLDKWFENRIYPSSNGLAIYFTDITEKKKQDKQNQMLLSLVETSDEFIGLASLKGEPIYLNTKGRALVGLEKDEVLPNSISDFFPKEYNKVIENEHMPAIEKEGKWYGEANFKNFKTNNLLPIEMSGFAIKDSKTQQPIALGVVASNIKKRKESESKIKNIQQKLQAAVRIGNIGYWSWDIVKDEVFWSDILYEIYDVDINKKLNYETVLSRVHPDDKAFHEEITKNRINNKSTEPFEYKVLRQDNTIRYVMVQMEVVVNEMDKAIMFQGTVIDITERKAAEEKLRDSELLFRGLTHGAPVAMFKTNKEGECIFVNDGWIKYSGLTYQQSLGYGWTDSIHPDDKDRILSGWHQALKNKEDYLTDLRFVNKKDEILWFTSKSAALFDDNKQFQGYVGLLIDITERKAAEEKLIKSEHLFKRLTSKAPAGIFQTDANGYCNYVNERWIEYAGIDYNEAMGYGWADAIHPDDRERITIEWEAYMKSSSKELETSFRFKHKNGKITWVSVKTVGTFDSKNNINGYIGMALDVTDRKIAEEKLINSEKLFRELTSNAPVGIFKMDLDGTCNYVNATWVKYADMSYNDAMGFGWTQAIHPEDRDRVLQSWMKAVSLKKNYYVDLRFKNKKGKITWLSVSAVRTFNANNKLYGYIGVALDVTTKKNNEKLEIKHKQYLNNIINNIGDPVFVKDENSKLILVNNALCSLFNLPREQILGKTLTEKVPYEERERFLEIDKQVLATGVENVNEETVSLNNQIIRTLSVKKTRYIDVSNKKLLIGVIRDITERKKDEIKIKESQEKFLKVFQSSAIGYSIINMDQIRIDVNEALAGMLETTREHLIGNKLEDPTVEIIDAKYYEQKDKLFKKMMTQGFLSNEKLTRTLVSGKKISLLVSVEAIEIGGEPHALFAVIDNTEKQKSELELEIYRNKLEDLVELRTLELEKEKEKAQSADLMKSAFLATMSHELRTPMNSIIGFTGILLKQLAGPLNDEQKKQLTMVKSSGESLLSLINDILDVSKIEAGKLNVAYSAFKYLEILEKTIAFLTPQAVKKGLKIKTEISNFDIVIESDERRVEQILLNLISNAIKFSNKGIISIKVKLEGNFVITKIIDQGIGIEAKHIKTLFEPFVQLEAGLSRRHEGTGLGLSISKSLVEKLGGEILVKSQLGEGSTFTFKLPLKSKK